MLAEDPNKPQAQGFESYLAAAFRLKRECFLTAPLDVACYLQSGKSEPLSGLGGACRPLKEGPHSLEVMGNDTREQLG
jgi:hypothetical protein